MNIKDKNNPEILNNFLKELYSNDMSKNTIKTYESHIEEFCKFFKYNHRAKKNNTNINDIQINKLSKNDLNKVNSKDIDDYKFYLKDGKKNSASTRNNKLSALDTFFDYCELKNNPVKNTKRPKQVKNKTVEYLEKNEIISLLKTIKKDESEFGLRNLTMFTLLFSTGLRYDELVNLTIQQTEKLESTIRIIGKGNKERTIYFNEVCLNLLKKYIIERKKISTKSDLLFLSDKNNNKPISNKQLNRIFKRYAKEASIQKDVHIHMTRHSFATEAYSSGQIDIHQLQEILGHSSISTTTIYASVKQNTIKNAMMNFRI